MSTSRRGFLGRLLAAAIAPVVPTITVAKAAPVVSKLTGLGADFDGNVEMGSVGRGMTRPVFLYDEDVRFYYPMHDEVHPDVAAKLNASFRKTLT